MLRTHRESGADATVAVIPVAEEQTSAFGILKMDNTGRIVHFDEKPPRRAPARPGLGAARAAAAGYLASMGIYIFRRDVLEEALSRTRSWSTSAATSSPTRCRASACRRTSTRLLGGRRDDPVVLPGQPGAVRADPAVRFLRRGPPRSTPTRASCPASKVEGCDIHERADLRGLHHARRRDRARRHRHPQPHRREACASATACSSAPTATRRSTRCAPADARGVPPVGIGAGLDHRERDHRQERAHRPRRPDRQRGGHQGEATATATSSARAS